MQGYDLMGAYDRIINVMCELQDLSDEVPECPESAQLILILESLGSVADTLRTRAEQDEEASTNRHLTLVAD